uniref:non-specific serine/threonine protein kinase n=1 Tax=Oryza brachyantha TaxID=4533 RepID=J3LV49_ORYBR
MPSLCIFLGLLLFSLQSPPCSAATDTLKAGQVLAAGDKLVSRNGKFALGFFKPSANISKSSDNISSSWYVGIWFDKIPVFTVVWVANRETPVTEPQLKVTQLKISQDGNLAIVDHATESIIWSTHIVINRTETSMNTSTAVLHDSGNLVIESPSNVPLWQSFDDPTDVALPNAKIGWNKVTGLNRVGVSKKSMIDMSNKFKWCAAPLHDAEDSSGIKAFRYTDLVHATKNFSEKLGAGGFGSVFKGTLSDLTAIAVKRLDGDRQGEKQFRAEVSSIGLIQHINLVKLIGFCCQDFGMAAFVGRDFSRITTFRGTVGYLAPEWISGVAITPKVDVYSFGMVLLEIISGRRNMPEESASGNYHVSFFPMQAINKLHEGDVQSLVDPRLHDDFSLEEAERILKVACWCIQDDDLDRPTMVEVVRVLEGLQELEIPPMPRLLAALTG